MQKKCKTGSKSVKAAASYVDKIIYGQNRRDTAKDVIIAHR